jgi:hypothetical protein
MNLKVLVKRKMFFINFFVGGKNFEKKVGVGKITGFVK